MLANFLIGLREGLEAALVVGILVAYLIRTNRRDSLKWVWAGVATATAISLLFGAILTYGPRELSEQAEETIAGVLSILTVAMVTWMIFWMAKTARGLRDQLQDQLQHAVAAGPVAVFTLSVLAVGREGLETALFLWAGVRATGESTEPLIGAALGIAVAVLLGIAITVGAVRINLTKFFTYTAVLLIFVAAGILSYGIHELQEVGLLPGGESLAFDITAQLPPGSWYATVLKGTFNISPTMTWLQVICWLAYVGSVLPLFLRTVRPRRDLSASASAPADHSERSEAELSATSGR